MLRIVSGGQTGAGREALDFAIQHEIPHGGWCPKGRLAEDGVISAHYRIEETPSSEYAERTEWNVRDSDGTVVFSTGAVLKGGSLETVTVAEKHQKPVLHVSRDHDGAVAGEKLAKFIEEHRIQVLNVAGPRASEEPEVGEFVQRILGEVLTNGINSLA